MNIEAFQTLSRRYRRLPRLPTTREINIATLSRPLRRITIQQAIEAMAEFPIRKAGTERVALAAAEGRVLAQEIVALESVPAFARSRVDGYAVLATDVRSAAKEKPVMLELLGAVSMGADTNLALHSGQAVRVPTGGALPAGTSGVVMVEATQERGNEVIVYDGDECEDHITQAASDFAAGDALFHPSEVLTPAAVGLLSAAGLEAVTVYKLPLIGVLVTGDELVQPGQPLLRGQIREVNGVTLTAALRAMGFSPRRYDRVVDDRNTLEKALQRALSECDAVVISGGSSVGERDYTPEVVAAVGAPGVIVHGVKAKPGRPALLAMIGDQAVIGLPGNPVSALVVLEAVAKPILLRMFGKIDSVPAYRARLEQRIDVDPDYECRVPVKLARSELGMVARPLLGSSAQMHILGFADALIVVPLGSGGVDAGTWVDAIPLSRSRPLC